MAYPREPVVDDEPLPEDELTVDDELEEETPEDDEPPADDEPAEEPPADDEPPVDEEPAPKPLSRSARRIQSLDERLKNTQRELDEIKRRPAAPDPNAIALQQQREREEEEAVLLERPRQDFQILQRSRHAAIGPEIQQSGRACAGSSRPNLIREFRGQTSGLCAVHGRGRISTRPSAPRRHEPAAPSHCPNRLGGGDGKAGQAGGDQTAQAGCGIECPPSGAARKRAE